MIRTIREMLGFKAKGASIIISRSWLHFIITFHKITGIELYTRFFRIHLHHDSCLVSLCPGSKTQTLVVAFVQHKVVIIALAILQLRVIIVDMSTNGLYLT